MVVFKTSENNIWNILCYLLKRPMKEGELCTRKLENFQNLKPNLTGRLYVLAYSI